MRSVVTDIDNLRAIACEVHRDSDRTCPHLGSLLSRKRSVLKLIASVVERRPRNEVALIATDWVVTLMPQPQPHRHGSNQQLVHRDVRLETMAIAATRPDPSVPKT